MNKLYFGDNLEVLRNDISDESVDLVYLDPPFKSDQDYNVLFEEQDGSKSSAQIKVFADTWHWDQKAAEAYQSIVEGPNANLSRTMQAFRMQLGENDMLAYLAMMAPRLVELQRVLRAEGSLYLHCDPTASHYLRVLMDSIFGIRGFRNEIIWPRTNAHNIASRHFSRVHDTLFFYVKSDTYTWNHQFAEFAPKQLKRYSEDPATGRLVTGQDLTMSGNTERNFEWRGTRPAPNRGWGLSLEGLEDLWARGLILTKKDGTPRLDGHKVFLDEKSGKPVIDVWSDIDRIGNTARERLGYPTQKPEALLERIISASSNKGDVVLDPFCGCGTTIAAAQKLGRSWIGIDITYLAINLIRHRLQDMFGEDAAFDVEGQPVSVADAEALAREDPFQFQWWATSLVGARATEQKKGPDQGIDGRLYFHEDTRGRKTKQIILSVKSGKTGVRDVRDLCAVIEREKAEIGVLITMQEPTRPMRTEASGMGAYASPWGKHPRLQIRTVRDLLDGKGIDMPPLRQVNRTFRRAQRDLRNDSRQLSILHPETDT